jgi:hypothetical protein
MKTAANIDAKCPNLVEWLEWVILMCNKRDRPYVPNISELQAFCKTKTHNKCPYYKLDNIMPSVKDLNN